MKQKEREKDEAEITKGVKKKEVPMRESNPQPLNLQPAITTT